jgi:hypothetical protein
MHEALIKSVRESLKVKYSESKTSMEMSLVDYSDLVEALEMAVGFCQMQIIL